jgi:glycosyltransferase involved in cell wall biosynthesis
MEETTMKGKMKLLLISDPVLHKRNGSYYSLDTFLKFALHLGQHFEKISLCCPVLETDSSNEVLFRIPLEETQNIEIVCTYPYESVVEYYRKLPVIVTHNMPILEKAIRESDAIFLRIPAMNAFPAAYLAKKYRKPIFSYFIGDEKAILKTGSKYKGLTRSAALAVSRLHDVLYRKIISSSRASFFLSSQLKEKYGRYSENPFLIFTSLVEGAAASGRNGSGNHNGCKRLLYVGRLSHEKGLEYLIRAVEYLNREKYDVKVSLCGDGPERERLSGLVRESGLSDSVKFHGYIPWGKELSRISSGSDLFVLPSHSEGVPKVLLEAMAAGLPVIATNVGGIPDIITNNENGILIPPGSPEAIADAVKLVMENSSLREKLIENGYGFVKNHTAENQAKKLAELIYRHA